jgi:hypothetical protein
VQGGGGDDGTVDMPVLMTQALMQSQVKELRAAPVARLATEASLAVKPVMATSVTRALMAAGAARCVMALKRGRTAPPQAAQPG